MKAILEFNLPEDQSEYDLANKAAALNSALWDFAQTLRTRWKHECPQTKTPGEEYEAIRTAFYAILEDHEVTLV